MATRRAQRCVSYPQRTRAAKKVAEQSTGEVFDARHDPAVLLWIDTMLSLPYLTPSLFPALIHETPQAAAEKETREKREFVDHSDRCERFGFDDHNPCPLAMIRPFCESLQAWLSQREFAFSAMQCGQCKCVWWWWWW